MCHKGERTYPLHITDLLTRYKTEVYARDLNSPSSAWISKPELPDARMWHGCVEAEVDGVKG